MLASVSSLVHTVDWTKPSWDLLVLGIFVFFSILMAVRSNRGIVVTLASTYMALVLVNYLPFLGQFSNVNVGGVFIFKVSAFLAAFFLLSFLMGKSALAAGRKKSGGRIQVFIFSFLHIGLLMAAIFSFLPASVTGKLAPLTKALFVNNIAFFVWIVLPILFMILFRSKTKAAAPTED
jgi:hypothetical protein